MPTSRPAPGARARNVLFITADQFRGDCLSALGHPLVRTPNLDALAADGTLFTRHYAQCAPCGPSRASLYTGLYMHTHRSVRNGTPLDGRHTNIALETRKAGYRPALFGYTDTSLDPRFHPEDVISRVGYQGVLPGFDDVVHLTDSLDPWIAHLKDRGYTIPENSRDIYNPVNGYPGAEGRGRAYAPPIYSDADSEAAFLTDAIVDYVKATPDPWFVHVSYLPPHPPFCRRPLRQPAACPRPLPVG